MTVPVLSEKTLFVVQAQYLCVIVTHLSPDGTLKDPQCGQYVLSSRFVAPSIPGRNRYLEQDYQLGYR